MIIVNELEYIQNCLKNKTLGESPRQTLALYARMLFHEGLKRKEIAAKLTEFLKEAEGDLYGIETVEWIKFIDGLSRKNDLPPLSCVHGVGITKKELDSIKTLNNKLAERLMFTMLSLGKLNYLKRPASNGWVNQSQLSNLFKIANVKSRGNERLELINYLFKRGMIDIPHDPTIVNFRVINMDFDNESVLFIDRFDQLGMIYQDYTGDGRFYRCAECGKIVKYKSKNDYSSRYCRDCSAVKVRESKRNYARSKRS